MKRMCCQCRKAVKYVKRPGWEVALDEKGRTWKGAMCPTCKPKYNERYEQIIPSKICDQCFNTYVPSTKDQKFCETKCRVAHFRALKKL